MTDRYGALIVVLEQDIRSDEAEDLIKAIEQLRGVLKVKPHVGSCAQTEIAQNRARRELEIKLLKVLEE